MTQPRSNRRKLRRGDVIALLAAVALTTYWAWTYTGVYRWLAELQLRLMREYGVELTFVVSLIVAYVPFFFLAAVARRTISRNRHSASTPIQKTSPPSPIRLPLWIGGSFALIGIGLAVAGAYQYHRGQSAGQIVNADAADYESGRAPAAEYLSLTGHSLSDAGQSFQSGDSGIKYFIPLVSTNWQPGKPVGIFLETDAPNMMPQNYYQRSQIGGDQIPEIWQGMTDPSGLPGPVRTQFENQHLAFADGYRLLYIGQTPQYLCSEGQTMIRCGGAVAVLSILAAGIAVPFILWRQRTRPKVVAIPIDPRLQVASIGYSTSPAPPAAPILVPPLLQPSETSVSRGLKALSIPRLIIAIALIFFGFPLSVWGFLAVAFMVDAINKSGGKGSWAGVYLMVAMMLLGIAMSLLGLIMGIGQILRGWKAIRERR